MSIKLNDVVYYLGENDYNIRYFENHIPLLNGVSYNSYLYMDEKTLLMDTVDRSYTDSFLNNLFETLNGRTLDYLLINHMEPDHSALIKVILQNFPECILITNKIAYSMIKQFTNEQYDSRLQIVDESSEVSIGKSKFNFVFTPMVHWPESMMSFDKTHKILYSQDAFGSFNTLVGDLYYKEGKDLSYVDEARRYYTNIVAKFGPQVLKALQKASTVDFDYVYPLHGYLFKKEDVLPFLNLYVKWASYEAETNGVLIVFASMYGNTEEVAKKLYHEFINQKYFDVELVSANLLDKSYIISKIFKYKKIVFLSPNYNNCVYPKINEIIDTLLNINIKNRTYCLIENGTWLQVSNKLIKEKLVKLPDSKILDIDLKVKSTYNDSYSSSIKEIVKELSK